MATELTLHELVTDWQQIVEAMILWVAIAWIVAALLGNRPWPPWWSMGIFGIVAVQRAREEFYE